jgi:hypothetical protein
MQNSHSDSRDLNVIHHTLYLRMLTNILKQVNIIWDEM